MLYKDLFHFTKSQITNIEISDIDIKLLISAATNKNWQEIYSISSNEEVPSSELRKLDDFIDRKNNGEPTLLISGSTEFYGYPIKVFPHVLIPRPETEELVSQLLQDIGKFKAPIHLLEVGTGSGCILTAVSMELIKKQIGFKFEGFEISSEAYAATVYNLTQNLGLQSVDGLFKTDLFEIKINHQEFNSDLIRKDVDIIISNPPYLTRQEYENLDPSVKIYEPEIALRAGADGLETYQQILGFIAKNKIKPYLYMETGPEVAKSAQQLFSKLYPKIKIKKDLFGLERFLLS